MFQNSIFVKKLKFEVRFCQVRSVQSSDPSLVYNSDGFGSGSGTKKVRFSPLVSGFWLQKEPKVGFGSSSGTISRVWVGFGYLKSRVFPLVFGYPNSSLNRNAILLHQYIQRDLFLEVNNKIKVVVI